MKGHCIVCHEDVMDHELGTSRMHAECGVLLAMGGIGHVLNHEHWCLVERDPDAGMSRRESAKMVWDWLQEQRREATQ